jgi:hypothetical protein
VREFSILSPELPGEDNLPVVEERLEAAVLAE